MGTWEPETGNPGPRPPTEIGPEPATRNPGTRNREPGNPARNQNRRGTFAKSFNFREDPFNELTDWGISRPLQLRILPPRIIITKNDYDHDYREGHHHYYGDGQLHIAATTATTIATITTITNTTTATTISSYEDLTNQIDNYLEQKDESSIKRPDHCGLYTVIPNAVEFWQERDNRTHERLKYTLLDDQKWSSHLLSP